jgi:hypothetical protein
VTAAATIAVATAANRVEAGLLPTGFRGIGLARE